MTLRLSCRWLRAAALAATLASGVGSCLWTSSGDGKALRRDVGNLSVKEAEISGKLDEIRRAFDEASKLLKRNSADLGADVDALRHDVASASGMMSTTKNLVDEIKAYIDEYKTSNDARLAAIEQRLVALDGRIAGNPDELWSAGKAAYDQGNWEVARDKFKKLATDFSSDDHADDAQYLRAESHAQEKQWEPAIREYQKVWSNFPKSDLVDDALLHAAEAAEELKKCAEARAYLAVLKKKYRGSEHAKEADAMDRKLRAALRNKAKCSA
jgi:TolA-binding protein